MTYDVDAYEHRRERLKEAVDSAPLSLSELVWNLSTRLGERQSYNYIQAVLSGRKRSKPVLNKIENQLEAEGIV